MMPAVSVAKGYGLGLSTGEAINKFKFHPQLKVPTFCHRQQITVDITILHFTLLLMLITSKLTAIS